MNIKESDPFACVVEGILTIAIPTKWISGQNDNYTTWFWPGDSISKRASQEYWDVDVLNWQIKKGEIDKYFCKYCYSITLLNLSTTIYNYLFP